MATRTPWAKLWTGSFLSSRRVRQTTYAQHGLWLALVVRTHSSDEAWTAEQVAADLGILPSRTKRFYKDLAALEVAGLIERFPDETLMVPRFQGLQSKPKRKTNG